MLSDILFFGLVFIVYPLVHIEVKILVTFLGYYWKRGSGRFALAAKYNNNKPAKYKRNQTQLVFNRLVKADSNKAMIL